MCLHPNTHAHTAGFVWRVVGSDGLRVLSRPSLPHVVCLQPQEFHFAARQRSGSANGDLDAHSAGAYTNGVGGGAHAEATAVPPPPIAPLPVAPLPAATSGPDAGGRAGSDSGGDQRLAMPPRVFPVGPPPLPPGVDVGGGVGGGGIPVGGHLRDALARDVTRLLVTSGDLSPSATSPFGRHKR
jgi:hypothetical protein